MAASLGRLDVLLRRSALVPRSGYAAGNSTLTPLPANDNNAGGSTHWRERLGGTLKYYYRDTA